MRPSAACNSVQSKDVLSTDSLLMWSHLRAYSTAAAINSSVTNVVQFGRGEIHTGANSSVNAIGPTCDVDHVVNAAGIPTHP